MNIERLEIDERSFRWMLNQDAMATEKHELLLQKLAFCPRVR
jgi:hypothetical protein